VGVIRKGLKEEESRVSKGRVELRRYERSGERAGIIGMKKSGGREITGEGDRLGGVGNRDYREET
jgi:hypothetical protein